MTLSVLTSLVRVRLALVSLTPGVLTMAVYSPGAVASQADPGTKQIITIASVAEGNPPTPSNPPSTSPSDSPSHMIRWGMHVQRGSRGFGT